MRNRVLHTRLKMTNTKLYNLKRKRILLLANSDWFIYNFNNYLCTKLLEEGYDLTIACPDGAYAQKLRNCGFNVCSIDIDRKGTNILNELKTIIYLFLFMRKNHFDIAHFFTIKCCVYGSIVAFLMRVPVYVNSITGLGYVFTSDSLKTKILRPLVKTLMKISFIGKNCKVIVLNSSDKEFFVKNNIVRENKLHVIYGTGVNCKKYYKSTISRPCQDFCLLLPARMLWDKGIADYVEASKIISDLGLKYKFILAGGLDENNPSAISSEKINEWVNDGLIDWLGHVEDMDRLYQIVNAVVLPSYREGMPTVLIEAAASALPIITTDVPGCNEIVANGINGLIVPAKNPQALSKAIIELANCPELCRRLGSAAQQNAVLKYDNQAIYEQISKLYLS
jgi:glycosyltransferase involved in cell wall biosynthesis